MSANPFDNLTDEQLRDLAEAGLAWQETIEPLLRTGTEGVMPCPRCQSDMRWRRDGGAWEVTCEHCGWNACGLLGELVSKH